MSTDDEWERWGKTDPYYGVFTNEKYRAAKLDEAARIEFFESGEWHVQYVWDVCRRYVDMAFSPRSVLDFGCGVGRVLIPMAVRATNVMGVDVSQSMLKEAQRNCERAGVGNVVLCHPDEAFSKDRIEFDFIHSVIVFQHIEADRGRAIFARLLELLSSGGIAAVQVTYAKTMHARTFGMEPQKVKQDLQVAPVKRRGLLRVLSGTSPTPAQPPDQPSVEDASSEIEAAGDPEMQMNSYNLNHLMFLMQTAGVTRFHTEFTDHGGELGVFLFFQKPKA